MSHRLPGPLRPDQHPTDIRDGTSALAMSNAPLAAGKVEHEAYGGDHRTAVHAGHVSPYLDEEDAEKAEHLAHYAHELHLAAEGVEVGAHVVHKAIKFVEHAEAAYKLMKTHAQMAYDLRRMNRGISALQRMAKEGGKAGELARQKLTEAKDAYEAAAAAFTKERGAVRAANIVVREYKSVQSGLKATALVKLGTAAAELEMALNGSRVGRMLMTTGRVVASKPFTRGLIVIGAGLEAVAGYADSSAQTTAGKVTNAALGGAGGALTMVNPAVAAVDLVVPKGYKPSEVFRGTAGALTVIGEAFLTEDTKPLDEFHKKSMEGHYGKVMQAASEAGEYWADKGIVDGLKEFTDAVRWWVSH
jgi:hypothetical protein